MRIPDTTASLDTQNLTIITYLREIVQQSSDTCKNIAISTQCSLQGSGVDTECNSACFRRSRTRNVLDNPTDIPDVSNGKGFPVKFVYRT